MGCAVLKSKVKMKNMLPKNYEISSASGEITLKKDEAFDILCFEINFDRFISTRVRISPINSPGTPPTTPVPDSDDSGYHCQ